MYLYQGALYDNSVFLEEKNNIHSIMYELKEFIELL